MNVAPCPKCQTPTKLDFRKVPGSYYGQSFNLCPVCGWERNLDDSTILREYLPKELPVLKVRNAPKSRRYQPGDLCMTVRWGEMPYLVTLRLRKAPDSIGFAGYIQRVQIERGRKDRNYWEYLARPTFRTAVKVDLERQLLTIVTSGVQAGQYRLVMPASEAAI